MNSLTSWAQAHPMPASLAGVLLLAAAALLARMVRKATDWPPAAVLVASLAAMACTAYSADTSWRFAEHRLDMASAAERGAMFAAAELALFACALMARQNLRGPQGAPGTPGLLVWVITGVQVIPAYSESGVVGGTVRAVVGPVLAAVLWHLAMGIELRHARPGADSSSLPALVAREGRERMLSRLGLATRDRSAEQITRDRWTVKAVGLAAKLADMEPGSRGRARVARRLSVAVGRAQAGASAEQRTKLLDLLAARRHAAALATIDLPSPWVNRGEVATVASVSLTDADVAQTATTAEGAGASRVDIDTVAEERPELPPARPAVVPAGMRLLPLVARPEPVEVTAEDPAPAFRWDNIRGRLVDVDEGTDALRRCRVCGVANIPADVWARISRVCTLCSSPQTTTEDDQPTPPETTPEVVTPADDDWSPSPPAGPHDEDGLTPALGPVAVPAEQPRQVVTEVIALTPSELLKRAAKLNRDLVRTTHRPVTIARLQEEFNLSRRDATELRRQVVTTKPEERS
ncbi:hypothetical protein [Streptomyces sp. NPDC051636]|uniref:hypothetical protein n=1 Tax=Streptomyces sp. NPDC051636 TaxID=3365663 RepID=UPI0037AD09D2